MKSRYHRIRAILLVFAVALVFAASCTSPAESPSPAAIIDQLGRAVTLDKPPQRIISLAPGNTEILYALGLADRVVAVTDYDDYPPEAKGKPSIGGFSTPNIEEVVSMNPDLIIATSIHESRVIPQLEARGLTVLALNSQTIDQVLEAIKLVSRVCRVEESGDALIASMQKRIKAVADNIAGLSEAQRPGVLYVVWHDPIMAAGSGTLQDDLIRRAGGINAAGDVKDYADISMEAVLAANPQVIIINTGHGSGEDQTYQYVKNEDRLRDTDARKYNRVYPIDGDLSSRPGPRIVDGLEQFARFIHPELFEQD